MIINRCKLSSSKPKNQVVETLGSNPVPGARLITLKPRPSSLTEMSNHLC